MKSLKSTLFLILLSTSSCSMLSGLLSGGGAPLPPSNAPTFNPGGGSPVGGIGLVEPLALDQPALLSQESYQEVWLYCSYQCSSRKQW